MSLPPWTLRDGAVADVPAMHALDLLCFDPPFRFDLRSMRRFAQHLGAIVLAADSPSGLAGFVILHLERRAHQVIAYVVTLDVAPAFRRARLASELMRAAEQRALAANVEFAGLHVFTGNHAAISFYERSGYERLRLCAGFYGEGLDAWSYRKRLAKVANMKLDPSGKS